MSEGEDWKDVRLVAKPDEPFNVGLSRMGGVDVVTLACAGAMLGFASEGVEVWNEDGTLALTPEQFRAGLLGILVLDAETGHAPFELCLSMSGVKQLRALLARLEAAMADEGGAVSREIAEGNVERVERTEFLPDDVDPGRTH